MTDKNLAMNRRAFVRVGTAAASGSFLSSAASAADPKHAEKQMKYRPLGKTEIEVPEVCFGTYGFSNSALLEEAIDRGINLVCTAAAYQDGIAEEAVGKVMKRRRKDAILFTGWDCRTRTKKKVLLEELDGSLKRLQTDYIDIIKSGDLKTPRELDNDEQFEAFEEAKAAGKVGAFGVSFHTGNSDALLKKALSIDLVQVIQCKYNFMEFPAQMELFDTARKKGVGVIAFKVGAGKRKGEIKDLEEKGLSFDQATVRWALSNKSVSSVCVGITNFSQIEEMQGAVTHKFSQADTEVLRRYADAVDRTYCRYCSTCEPKCPYNVAVADIMRYAMYFKYYKMEKEAMRLYGRLDTPLRADACRDCEGHCERGCPHQRAVREGLLEARSLLT